MPAKSFYVYIMTNRGRTVLYTGITSDLLRRVHEHQLKVTPGFASKYHAYLLVYYEVAEGAEQAIAREKQTKAGSRAKKIALIEATNPGRQDLTGDI